jgi:hypothetical protein
MMMGMSTLTVPLLEPLCCAPACPGEVQHYVLSEGEGDDGEVDMLTVPLSKILEDGGEDGEARWRVPREREEEVSIAAVSMRRMEERAALVGLALDTKATAALQEIGHKKAEELLGRLALRVGEIRNVSAYVCKAVRRETAEKQAKAEEGAEDDEKESLEEWPEDAEGAEEGALEEWPGEADEKDHNDNTEKNWPEEGAEGVEEKEGREGRDEEGNEWNEEWRGEGDGDWGEHQEQHDGGDEWGEEDWPEEEQEENWEE